MLQTFYTHIILNIQVTTSSKQNPHNSNVALIGSQMQRCSAVLQENDTHNQALKHTQTDNLNKGQANKCV